MIELLRIRYGPGYFQEPGSRIEIDPHEEQALVKNGRAKWVQTPEANQAQPETAAIQTPQRRGKRR